MLVPLIHSFRLCLSNKGGVRALVVNGNKTLERKRKTRAQNRNHCIKKVQPQKVDSYIQKYYFSIYLCINWTSTNCINTQRKILLWYPYFFSWNMETNNNIMSADNSSNDSNSDSIWLYQIGYMCLKVFFISTSFCFWQLDSRLMRMY